MKMAWVSFVIVVLVFFNPFFGIGNRIPHEPFSFTMPFLAVPVNIPYSGYLRMFLVSVAIWALVWLLLVTLERLIGSRSSLQLEKLGLRNGTMFALYPWEVSQAAAIVAKIILGITVLKAGVDFVIALSKARILEYLLDSLSRNLMGRGVGYVFDFTTGTIRSGGIDFLPFAPNAPIIPIVPFLGGGSQPALPLPLFPCNVLVLCLLTLIAAYAFKREQISRYENEVRCRQRERKDEYKRKRARSPLSEE
jgi:hypothetical protein